MLLIITATAIDMLYIVGGVGNSQIHMIGVPTTMQQSHTISQVQQQQAPHQQGVRMNMVDFFSKCFRDRKYIDKEYQQISFSLTEQLKIYQLM